MGNEKDQIDKLTTEECIKNTDRLLILEQESFEEFCLRIARVVAITPDVFVNENLEGFMGYYYPRYFTQEAINLLDPTIPLLLFYKSLKNENISSSEIYDRFLFMSYSICEIYKISGEVFEAVIKSVLSNNTHPEFIKWTTKIKNDSHNLYTLDETFPDVHNIYNHEIGLSECKTITLGEKLELNGLEDIENAIWAACCQFLFDCFFIHYSAKKLYVHMQKGKIKSKGFTHLEGTYIADLYTMYGDFNKYIDPERTKAIRIQQDYFIKQANDKQAKANRALGLRGNKISAYALTILLRERFLADCTSTINLADKIVKLVLPFCKWNEITKNNQTDEIVLTGSNPANTLGGWLRRYSDLEKYPNIKSETQNTRLIAIADGLYKDDNMVDLTYVYEPPLNR